MKKNLLKSWRRFLSIALGVTVLTAFAVPAFATETDTIDTHDHATCDCCEFDHTISTLGAGISLPISGNDGDIVLRTYGSCADAKVIEGHMGLLIVDYGDLGIVATSTHSALFTGSWVTCTIQTRKIAVQYICTACNQYIPTVYWFNNEHEFPHV